VVFLDEADSFLRDRRWLEKSWEITLVNEVLVQMENHRGLFVCSTNLMDNLDPASLRRFDFKIGFDYLTFNQRWGLFVQLLAELNIELRENDVPRLRQQLQPIDHLTPGDFAVIKRQCLITGVPLVGTELLRRLGNENRIKSGQRQRTIGFENTTGPYRNRLMGRSGLGRYPLSDYLASDIASSDL
jgi:transitional endoplasmic reticulum ATPase